MYSRFEDKDKSDEKRCSVSDNDGQPNFVPIRSVPETCLPPAACSRLLLDAIRLRLELELFLDAPIPHL